MLVADPSRSDPSHPREVIAASAEAIGAALSPLLEQPYLVTEKHLRLNFERC
jgi:hypothetical protein